MTSSISMKDARARFHASDYTWATATSGLRNRIFSILYVFRLVRSEPA